MKFLTLFFAFLILNVCTVVGQTVFTVTNTNDDGAGSMRQAILDANSTSGTDTIAFDISGAAPHTIQPMSELPIITDPVVIDGTTEPDFVATPIIELDGSTAGPDASGLKITAGNSTVQGLIINRFSRDGIKLETSESNVIRGNYIGVDVTGTIALGNSWRGVVIGPNTHSNTIGGVTESERNIISGNGVSGVDIISSDTYNNTVSGNFIGTDVSGTIALGNVFYGVLIQDASDNTIGGSIPSARNVISGNYERGVYIYNASHNIVSSNYIGTDSTGTMALENVDAGIVIGSGSQFNIIGGNTDGEGNVISGNGGAGIAMWNDGTSHNTISGNFIGTDATGTVALGNFFEGIAIIDGADSNIIGGTMVEERNIISGNYDRGIVIRDSYTTGNIVIGNFIGTDVTGTDSIGNDGHGIYINDSPYNIIGGLTDEARNIISSNQQYGVRIQNDYARGNLVRGNYIGTDYSGMTALPNLSGGVYIRSGASNNIIGGTETGAGNVISGNQNSGILIGLDSTSGNIVQGNYIGTDATGEGALGNGANGIGIFLHSVDNLIGGEELGAGNIIAFNEGTGILLDHSSETLRNRLSRNSVFSNYEIGIDLSLNPDPPFRDGVTPNDRGDPDSGPNKLQNFPVLTSADIDLSGDLLIGYNVDSEPINSTYPLTIEFFESDTSGQGEIFIGADQYTVTDFNNGGKTVNVGNVDSLGIADSDIIVATTTDSDGNTSEFSSIDTVVTEISEIINHLPESYALYQNYPNPFNPSTNIKYSVPETGVVKLAIYNTLGEEVSVLVDGMEEAGFYEISFNASSLPSGVYFYRLQANDFTQIKKMILLK